MSNNLFVSLITRKSNQRKLAKTLLHTTPESIVEERYINIGGIGQWISIRGEDRHNPVLFIVHGGPAATYSIFTPLLRPWEKYFTIVQWDQRGAGKTLRKTGKSGTGTLTFDRLALDGIEIVEFLREHLHQEKIILLGSSAGSIISAIMATSRPDLFSVYVATDQNTTDPDGVSYQLILDGLRAAGDKKGVKVLEKIGPDATRWTRKEFDQVAPLMIKAKPNIPHMISDVIFPSMLTSPGHTIRDIIDIFIGMNFSSDQLHNELMSFDVRKLGMRYEMPFFLFQGDTDVVTPTVLARQYFDEIEAPHKEFALLKNAGHMAMFVRPEQFLDELLRRVRPLVVAANTLQRTH